MVVCLLHVAPLDAATAARTPAPTFTGQVLPILLQHCANCHAAGEIAASVPLLSYGAARSRAAQIKLQVLEGAMPPWFADPAHSLKFRNDPRLSATEIDTLVAWVNSDAPRGEDAALPSNPDSAKVWLDPLGRAPDAIVSLPEFTLNATGEIPYVQLRVKVPFENDRWISAMQVRPGNSAVVHHMGIAEVALADGVKPEDVETFAKLAGQLNMPGVTFGTTRPVVLDPDNPATYDMLGVYTPGTTYESYGAGNGKLLKGGKNLYINFNVHYTTTGKPEKDRSQLAFWFQSQPPAHQLYRVPASGKTIIANGRELLRDDPGTKAEGTNLAIPPIPPYMDNYELIGITGYAKAVTIYQLQPHAHFRGKDFTYAVVFPDGRQQTLLSVPRYDFHWQLAYELDVPLKLPAGSKLVVTAHYDNSTRNKGLTEMGASDPEHRCGPDKQAYFRGENQSWDEMFSPLIQYSIDDDDPSAVAAPGSQHSGLEIAEAVGCLVPGGRDTWLLTHASEPLATTTQSTSRAQLDAISARALGSAQYSLLGVGFFNPASRAARKVAVQGILIQDGAQTRLNVTSLQTIGGACRE